MCCAAKCHGFFQSGVETLRHHDRRRRRGVGASSGVAAAIGVVIAYIAMGVILLLRMASIRWKAAPPALQVAPGLSNVFEF